MMEEFFPTKNFFLIHIRSIYIFFQYTYLPYKELLSYNKVRTEAAGRLAGVLTHCASLAHLNLSNNDIGAAGAESFAGVLGQCPVLVHLYLGGNGIEAGFELLYKQSYRSIPADDEPSQSCNFCKMRL